MRAIVRSHGEGLGRVSLTDEDGTASLGNLADGVEVEVTAWRPRRGMGALYRVRPSRGGTEGWIGAVNLEAVPVPRERPAPQAPAAAPRAKAPASKAKRTRTR